MTRDALYRLVAVLASVVLVLGCGDGSSNQALLSDPREVIGKTIAVTSTIRTAHLRIEGESRTGNGAVGPARVDGAFVEGDIDLALGQVTAHGAARDGSGAFAVIRTADATFFQVPDQNRWMRLPQDMGGDPLAFFFGGGPRFGQAPAPRFPDLLGAIATDAGTQFELRGVEDCVTGRCYRTAVWIGPEQLWTLTMKLSGLDTLPGNAPVTERPSDFPGLTLEVVSDTETLRLVELIGSAAPPDSTVSFRLQLSNPNGPITIQAPPAHLIDNFGDMFGENVGG